VVSPGFLELPGSNKDDLLSAICAALLGFQPAVLRQSFLSTPIRSKVELMKLKKIPRFVKLTFWIVLVWGLSTLLSRWTEFPELNWLVLAILGIGIYLFQERTIAKMGGSQSLETGVIAVCGLVFILHLGWVFLAPRMAFEEAASQPCSNQSLELQCYTFSQSDCSSVWEHYSKDCGEEIKRTITARRSTALTGPILRRCIYKRLDQSFRSNRRTPLNERCEKLFSTLDAPFE